MTNKKTNLYFAKMANEALNDHSLPTRNNWNEGTQYLSLILRIPLAQADRVQKRYSLSIKRRFPTAVLYHAQRLHSTIIGFGEYSNHRENINRLVDCLRKIFELRTPFSVKLEKPNVLHGAIILELHDIEAGLFSLVKDMKNEIVTFIPNIHELIGVHEYAWWVTLSRNRESRADICNLVSEMPSFSEELVVDEIDLVVTDKVFNPSNTQLISRFRIK